MLNYPTAKMSDLEDKIRLFHEGITYTKTNAALKYAKDNDPDSRTEFLKLEYAEMQINIVRRWMEEGLIAIFHEANDAISEAVRTCKNPTKEM
jgi:hypothetical protein